jgi:proteasome alpha subunit
VGELYDRIGFAAVGRYSEFESLRRGGIRHVDLQGYQYDRRDVSARALANVYAQTLSTIFTEQLKPFEVEICVAQVGANSEEDELYRLTYDGSIVMDEPKFVVMGGQTEAINSKLKESFRDGMELGAALRVAVDALRAPSNTGGANTNGEGEPGKLEVAVLDRERPGRKFRRLTGAALDALMPASGEAETGADDDEDGSAGKDEPSSPSGDSP